MTHVKGYDKAAAQWEAQCQEWPEEQDECEHRWRLLGRADGHSYYKCSKCGEEGDN